MRRYDVAGLHLLLDTPTYQTLSEKSSCYLSQPFAVMASISILPPILDTYHLSKSWKKPRFNVFQFLNSKFRF